jgi:hypothetical protein
MKYDKAIVMLIFGKEHYMIGACIAAKVHREYLKNKEEKIDLIAMVDDKLYIYKKELLKFFDKVKKINLLEIKHNINGKLIDKYKDWMKYAINKWKILKYIKYNKILFLDIDLLPLNEQFYDIFNNETPSFYRIMSDGKLNDKIDKYEFLDDLTVENDNYGILGQKLKKFINASIVLLKPDKELYKKYKNFIKIYEGKDGYMPVDGSLVDEVTILLFYLIYLKQDIYDIPYNYGVIPWDKQYNKYINNDYKIMAINYVQMIKPWNKPGCLQWMEEKIWSYLVDKILENTEFHKMYKKNVLLELLLFNKYYENKNRNLKYYNNELIKTNNLKNTFLKIVNHISNNEKYIIINDFDKINKYYDLIKNLEYGMNNKYVFNYDESILRKMFS